MRESILFVDDDPKTLESYRRRYRTHFQVVTAGKPSQGLEMLRRNQFSAIVCDYRMPEMNGLQFFRRVRSQKSHSVNILLTGFGNLKIAQEAIEANCLNSFLTKPCRREDLLAAIESGKKNLQGNPAQQASNNGSTSASSVKLVMEIITNSGADAFRRYGRLDTLVSGLMCQLGYSKSDQLSMLCMLLEMCYPGVPLAQLAAAFNNQELSKQAQLHIQTVENQGQRLLNSHPNLKDMVIQLAGLKQLPADTDVGTALQFPIELHAVHTSLAYERQRDKGLSKEEALIQIERTKAYCHREVSQALQTLLLEPQTTVEVTKVMASGLQPGMKVARKVRNLKGITLVDADTVLTERMICHLLNFSRFDRLIEPIYVEDAVPAVTV